MDFPALSPAVAVHIDGRLALSLLLSFPVLELQHWHCWWKLSTEADSPGPFLIMRSERLQVLCHLTAQPLRLCAASSRPDLAVSGGGISAVPLTVNHPGPLTGVSMSTTTFSGHFAVGDAL